MNVSTDQKKIEELLTRGVEKIFPSREFLEARLKEGEQLSLYLGIDPTGPDLHIGHSIQLRKLRQFQDLGHKVILLIGDFTGMIGDPTDKSATRVRLTREQVLKNAERYKEQAGKILDFGGKNPVELKYNSKWLAKLSLVEVVELAAHFTVPQILARDMFKQRTKDGKDIYLHEFLYPLMQGYDSVAMDVDGEVGGNDQTFNMLAGRDLMKAMKGKEKFVIADKLLADPTGRKMGKSEGNMITLADSSDEMFGKVMSWTDGMIVGGFEILTMEDYRAVQTELDGGVNPRELKARLARTIVTQYFDEAEAMAASERFDQLFQKKEVPDEILEHRISGPMSIVDVLVASGLAKSKTDARRLIEGGGVKVDEVVVQDPEQMLESTKGGIVIQKGKRHFVRIVS
ncbi:MAG TPA: tyrosine--tRNA ligase [Patescibacteria group bacterium]|nr:tyrosine--tRNA ligase [Patescibacteria group bacterium]